MFFSLKVYNLRMQRLFDLFFSSLAIIMFSPILLILIILLRFSGEGEIFYSQERVGFKKRKFGLLKFATMLKNSPNLGSGTVTVKNDPRVLPFGKILRKTKINELPQLFNIFLGNMSIVGPRPLHEKQFSFYEDSDQLKIVSVKPGLSGMGSIIFRDEERYLEDSNDPDFTYRTKISPKKAALEKWYVKNASISLYFKIIIVTFIVVLFSNINAYKFFDSELKEVVKNV